MAKLTLLLAAFCLAVSAGAQDLHKLITLTTTSEVQDVISCGETGSVAALGSDGSITLWRLPSGEAVRKIAAQAGIRTVACSADAKWLAMGRQDGTVAIADTTGAPIRTLNVARQAIVGLAFSPDKTVLAVRVRNSPAQLWDADKAILIAALHTEFAGSGDMAFSPDGSLFASADLDTAVRIYDRAGRLKAKYTGLLLEPFTISFMPNGRELVVGGADSTLTILDASDGHLVRTLPRQTDPIFGAVVLPSGNEIVSVHVAAAGLNHVTTLLWNLQNDTPRELPVNGSQLKGFGVLENHQAVLFTSDSKTSLSVWALPG